MTDQAASSYVDQYAPPAASSVPPTPTEPTTPTMPATPAAPVAPAAPVMPPTAPVAPPTQPADPAPAATSQSLEEQNIFHLLGVTAASDKEKESFLDELQQVIWEDFLANDVDLLVTEEEKTDLKKIMDGKDKNDLATQEAVVVYLEKLIPDLEEIMLEKALELKGDMVKERLAGMKEFFASQPEKLQALEQAQTMLASDRWRDLADTLNKLSA